MYIKTNKALTKKYLTKFKESETADQIKEIVMQKI